MMFVRLASDMKVSGQSVFHQMLAPDQTLGVLHEGRSASISPGVHPHRTLDQR